MFYAEVNIKQSIGINCFYYHVYSLLLIKRHLDVFQLSRRPRFFFFLSSLVYLIASQCFCNKTKREFVINDNDLVRVRWCRETIKEAGSAGLNTRSHAGSIVVCQLTSIILMKTAGTWLTTIRASHRSLKFSRFLFLSHRRFHIYTNFWSLLKA